MSLHVQHLTKVYGTQRAVDDITFNVTEGEVVGFLGPNGAGKSTTMKVIAGYLPPSEGTVIVAGFDVGAQPLEAKKAIGYLPEHNPLYTDMYVHEYLNFIGRLYGLKGYELKERVGQMIELCGLTQEQNKKIQELSKGYRQRIGLAQALIHDPEVLILDEPTSGLDPNQIIEIRKLIKEVSVKKTVLFSTHILQEVQALCERVIVINKGKIVADDRIQNLMMDRSENIVLAEFDREIEPAELEQIAGVKSVALVTNYVYRVAADPSLDIRPAVFRFAADHSVSLIGLRQEENSLESIFKSLTENQSAE